jgi:hypothetical protein
MFSSERRHQFSEQDSGQNQEAHSVFRIEELGPQLNCEYRTEIMLQGKATLVVLSNLLRKIVAGALPGWVWRRPASPDRAWRPLAALHNYKARVPLSLSPPSRLSRGRPPSVPIHFVALSPPCCRPVDPFSAPFAPASYCLLRQSPLSTHFNDDYTPPSILRRPTLLQWPPVLIRPPLDHTFLVGGLALTTMSVTCLKILIASCLFVGRP